PDSPAHGGSPAPFRTTAVARGGLGDDSPPPGPNPRAPRTCRRSSPGSGPSGRDSGGCVAWRPTAASGGRALAGVAGRPFAGLPATRWAVRGTRGRTRVGASGPPAAGGRAGPTRTLGG